MRIVKIETLPSKKEAWVDRDELMLHSCFQILKDFVEKEHPMEHLHKETHKDFLEELEHLYAWWIRRQQEDTIEDTEEDDTMLSRLLKIRNCLWT